MGSTDLTHDGDGQQVKTAETPYDTQSGNGPTTTTYYVRSTVLGGAVIAQMIPAAASTRTFVYANGAVLATQWNGFVWWEHRDPSNASYRTTATDNRPGDEAELDPVGANMGRSDLTYHESVPEEGSLSPYPSFNGGANLATTYSADGIPIPQDEFFQMVNTLMHGRFGIAQALTNETRITGTARGHFGDGDFQIPVTVNWAMPIYGTNSMAMDLLSDMALLGQHKGKPGVSPPGGAGGSPECDVIIAKDVNQRAVVATIMGEATYPGWPRYTNATNDGRGNSSHEEAKHPEGVVSWDDTIMEMEYMVSVFVNRQRDSGGSWWDIANSKQTNGKFQFEGYPRGESDLGKLGSVGDPRCEQARWAVNALHNVMNHGPVNTNIHNWHAVLQEDDNGRFVRVRNGAIRVGGTDFW